MKKHTKGLSQFIGLTVLIAVAFVAANAIAAAY